MSSKWMPAKFIVWVLAFGVGAAGPALAEATARSVCPEAPRRADMRPTLTSDFTKWRAFAAGPWRPSSGLHQGGESVEAQFYDPSQAAFAGSTGLKLSAKPQSKLGKAYASSEVTTRGLFSQRYGHFEMMAKMPQANGMWPAFWMLPTTDSWPPEIDVIEYIYAVNGVLPAAKASDPRFWVASHASTSLHWGTIAQHQQTSPMVGNTIPQYLTYRDWNTKPPPAGWSNAYTGYHVYSVDWRPGSVIWTIDDEPVFCAADTVESGSRVPSVPMYLLISLEVSKGTKEAPLWAGYVEDGTRWPQTMDVAYVHVFQYKDF